MWTNKHRRLAKAAFKKPSVRRKMSKAAFERWAKPGFREKAVEAQIGHKVSKSTRRKISKKTKGRKAPNRGVPHSEETKRKISKANRGRKRTIAQRSEARRIKKKWHKEHPGIFKGKKIPLRTRKKISETQKQQFASGERTQHEPVYKGFRYRGIWYRSSWEKAFAKWLYEIGEPFEFEKHRFVIPKIGVYTPDFYLPKRGLFVEVKGNLQVASFGDRFIWFIKNRKEMLVIVDGKILQRLGLIDKHQLPTKRYR